MIRTRSTPAVGDGKNRLKKKNNVATVQVYSACSIGILLTLTKYYKNFTFFFALQELSKSTTPHSLKDVVISSGIVCFFKAIEKYYSEYSLFFLHYYYHHNNDADGDNDVRVVPESRQVKLTSDPTCREERQQ
jgi:hypothetical protein